MNLIKKLQEIEQHFNEINEEDFEKKLIKAGLGEIEHSYQSQMKMITPEDLRQVITYSKTKVAYNFEELPDKVTEPVKENMFLLAAAV